VHHVTNRLQKVKERTEATGVPELRAEKHNSYMGLRWRKRKLHNEQLLNLFSLPPHQKKIGKIKIKVKSKLEEATKVQRGSRGIDPLFL